MKTARVEINIPEELVQYAVPKPEDEEALLVRNAMLLYPYIRKNIISHGRAAEILGIYKVDLIALYGSYGLPYFDMTEEELDDDLQTLRKLRGLDQ